MLPDFLCIGAMKAGTSWLYHNIKYHPDVQMPPYKEIFYFHPMPSLPTITQIFVKRRGRRRRAWRVATHYLPNNLRHAGWFLRYLLLPRSDRWYASLFCREEGKISGDVTPTYARLKRRHVAKVHALLPNAKIIYIVRNPVFRSWSQTAMHFENWERGLENADDDQIYAFFDRDGGMADSRYIQTLEIWESFYPEDQIMVAFLDKLTQDPDGFLTDIYRFLGLEVSDQYIPPEVATKRNVRDYPPMPDHVARYLAMVLQEQVEQMHLRFNNEYTANWLETINQYR